MTYELLLSCFVLFIPLFGKAINYTESLIFYGGTILFFFFNLIRKSPRQLTKHFVIYEITLVILSLISTIFSQNIGFSYYVFFNFIFSLIILNLCLKYLHPDKLSLFIVYFSLLYSLIFLLIKFHFIPTIVDPVLDNVIPQIWGHSYIADFLIFPIPFLIYQLINSKFKSKNSQYFYYFSLFFILITIFLTNSRTAIIAISLSTIYIVLPHLTKYLKIPFIILIIGIATFINFQSFLQNRYIKSYDGRRLEYWSESIKAFIDRPLIGQGPGNFSFINKKYQSIPNTNTNYSHNSFLEYLCLNGLTFTLIIFSLVILSLLYQYQHHSLNFAIGLTALINSFFEPSWSSIGIFCLSLFYIFNSFPLIVSSTQKFSSKNKLLSIITLTLICLFFISKTTSDYFFVSNQNSLSLRLDPFNLNPRLAELNKNLASTLILFPNSTSLYLSLINDQVPTADNEKYFLKLISLNPKENIDVYSKLAKYYSDVNDYQNLNRLLSKIDNNFISNNYPNSITLPIAKIAYKLAITEWKNKEFPQAINHFKQAVKLSHGWSHFHIELANAYWHSNQKDNALNQLNVECPIFPNSIKHCQEYSQSHSKKFLEPGTKGFVDSIDKIVVAN